MKRSIFSVLAVLALCACAPQAYVMQLDLRNPSSSGMDLDGKTISVVYLETDVPRDTIFSNALADGFAQGLEKEYFNSMPDIGVYSITDNGGAYSSKDSLTSLVMSLNSDVVFLVDKPEFSDNLENGKLSYSSRIYGYDSMDPKDKVYGFVSNGKLNPDISEGSLFASDAQMAGLKMSKPLINSWKTELLTLIYFDSDSNFERAIIFAESNQWEEAMDIWLRYSGSKNVIMLSSAAYNLAVGCYVTREYDLALQWLDLSDKTQPISPSASLRKRIEARMQL